MTILETIAYILKLRSVSGKTLEKPDGIEMNPFVVQGIAEKFANGIHG